jgi:hypothetical protein
MARVKKVLEVPRPAKEVFDYLADFSNAAEWDPGVQSGEKLTEGPIGEGTEFRLVATFGPRRLPLTYRITGYQPHTRVVFDADDRDFRSHDVITVQEIPTGARITYDAELVLRGWRAWADPFLQLAFYWIAGNAIRGLRQTLDPHAED